MSKTKAAKVIEEVFGQTPKELGSQISEACHEIWADLVRDELKDIRITQEKYSMTVTAKDLCTIFSVFEKDTTFKIPLRIAYFIWIGTGIKLKGFHPNKTALRVEYKISLEQINELLPGSYKLNHKWKRKSE